MKIFNVKRQNRNKGFSLIEMVIALGIFTVVVWATIDIVISAAHLQTKAEELRNVQDNIRFAIEFMSKEIRTGTQISTPGCGAPGSPCDIIAFRNDRNEDIRYCTDDGILMRLKAPSVNCDSAQDDDNNIHLTANNVSVGGVVFYVRGEQPSPDTEQPIVTITMKVSSLATVEAKYLTSMNLQTTIIPRMRDL